MSHIETFTRTIDTKNRKNVMTLAWEATGALLASNENIHIEIRPKKRSDEQNAKLHALLSEVAKEHTFNGQKLTLDEWKIILVSAHTKATGGEPKMIIGLEGEVINLRESTAKMSVRRIASLIEYIEAWRATEVICD